MRKGWKYQLVNLFLRIHTRQRDLIASRHAFLKDAELSNVSNIAVYSTTALGDFLMNTPAIHALRQRFSKARITLVAHPNFESFLSDGRDWDRIVYWNNKIKTVPQLVNTLKDNGPPDVVIILHSHAPYDYLSAVMTGARYIFRDNYIDNVAIMDRWLTNYTYNFKGHLIQRKLELVAPLGCDTKNPEMLLPYKPENKKDKEGNARLIGFQMGASTAERCWPVCFFAETANVLLKRDENLRIVLIGGPGEKGLEAPFFETVDPELKSRIDCMIGKTSLNGLVDTINNFSVLLTGDTGPMHIGIALDIPTVCLFVTAQPQLSGPYQSRERHRVIYGTRCALNPATLNDTGAMRSITPSEVITAISKILKL